MFSNFEFLHCIISQLKLKVLLDYEISFLDFLWVKPMSQFLVMKYLHFCVILITQIKNDC